MEFWGTELKPGKPHCFRLQSDRKLHVTKATLGEGLGKEKSVIQYSVGDSRSPVDLCALLPNENESCSFSLVFECDGDDSIEFSVIGGRCIWLTGYYVDINGGVVTEEIEDAKAYKPFRKNSIFRSKDLSDMILASKMCDVRGFRGFLDDTLPSPEERYRLWCTLSREEFRKAMKKYLLH